MSSTVIYSLVVFGSLSLISLFFIRNLSHLLGFDYFLIFLIYCHSFFMVIQEIYMQILIPQKKSREVAYIGIVNMILTTGLSVILVLRRNDKLYLGQIYANFVITVLFGFFFYYRKTNFVKYKNCFKDI